MSMSSSTRGRRWRSGLAVAAAAALTLVTAGIALADSVVVDGDTVKAPPNVQYGPVSNPANHACNTRGLAVDGSIDVAYDSSGGPVKHFTAGEDLTITATPSIPGITVVTPTAAIPDDWGTTTTLPLDLSTTVATSVPTGTYTITITATGQESGVTRDDTYDVTIDSTCPVSSSNHAPLVAFTSPPASAVEGTATTFTFSVADSDAGDSWSFASGYPDCGDGTVSNATTVPSTATSGSFDCTFPDGVDPKLPAAQTTVSVKVVDGAGAGSNTASTDVTVHNADPVVSTPSLDVASINCTQGVTLSPISFSDLGLGDAPWAVDIDWKDGSHTTYNATDQGDQADGTHTYNVPGTYRPTVTVTDKDGGTDTEESSNSVVVAQTYSVDFLPPFDDSTPSGLIVNKMKNGRVVPVKATIYDDCAGAFVTDPTENVTIKASKTSGTGTGDPIETYADAGQSASSTNQFRWSTDGFWIYNLDSKALNLIVNNNYRIDIYVDGVQATTKSWAVLQPVK